MNTWKEVSVSLLPRTHNTKAQVHAIGTRSDGKEFYVIQPVYNSKVESAKARARLALDDFLDAE